jgi:hypothetical protein
MSNMTLEQAKYTLQQNLAQGMECPCCQRFTKRYRRKLNNGMARSLIAIHRWFCQSGHQGHKWLHVVEEMGLTAHHEEYSKLRYWDLLEQDVREDGKPTGLWRITEKGYLFLENRLTVEKYVYLVNAELVGMNGPQVSIKDALGEKFDYEELMAV